MVISNIYFPTQVRRQPQEDVRNCAWSRGFLYKPVRELEQSHKNPVSNADQKVFANPESFCGKFIFG